MYIVVTEIKDLKSKCSVWFMSWNVLLKSKFRDLTKYLFMFYISLIVLLVLQFGNILLVKFIRI